MFRTVASRLFLAAALVVSFPVAAGAQAEAATPEGVEWHLAGYAVEGEVGIVPWYIDATLVLEEGIASGTTGCNRFSAGYVIEGQSLSFDETLTMTRVACPDEQAAVEDGYMANLPLVASWSIEDDVLSLTDADGAPLLDFERTVVGLTPSDVTALVLQLEDQQARIERHEERIDNIRISVLRERIKTLESQVKNLRAATAAKAPSSSGGGGTGFSAAEKVLIKGIPARIRSTCKPLRGGNLPSGTLAAVQCQPNTSVVKEMAYYLMDYADGERTFESVMDRQGAPERYRCHEGRAGQMLQSPYHATGCFVDGGAANLRLMTWASSCFELRVEGKRVREPIAYIAIEGSGGRIKPLYEWATSDDFEPSPVWRNIPVQQGAAASPACISSPS